LAENYYKKSKNKGEKEAVSDAVDNDDNDEGFVASQGVLFCATCESVNDEDYPVDDEGIFQPSRFAAFYPLPPPEISPESTWKEYFNYTRNHLPGGSIIYESTVSESSILQYFQPKDYRIVIVVMLRRYREYLQHELEPRHYF
jgi:hypothetical protein